MLNVTKHQVLKIASVFNSQRKLKTRQLEISAEEEDPGLDTA